MKDSIYSSNARGCDEIMCQFIKNLEKSCDISVTEVEAEQEIEPNNHSSVNLKMIIL
jgi:hypothetical protein